MKKFVRATIALLYLFITASASFGQNSKPVITGQNPSPLSTQENTPITIELSNLIVEDPDSATPYPDGFTLEVSGGKNYSVQGNTVTPDAGFPGMLSVPVRVENGNRKSDKFDLQINVIKAENERPVIKGQQPLGLEQGGSITLELADLTVTDPDNSYPTDFSMTVYAGNDYTFNGTTITPSPDFTGKLTVPVTVNDGQNESNRFNLRIDVTKKKNTAPVITGQQPLSVNQGSSITIDLSNLIVDDPDNSYPTDFTLNVYAGKDFTFNGTTVTPSADFFGQLTVPVTVNDGQADSKRFNLTIDVIKTQNIAPKITGQQPLSTMQGGSLTVDFTNLTVDDPDNAYPAGFTLTLYPGNNYTFNGATVTPSADFSGKLTVPVSVSDGQSESNRFNLKIDVTKKQNVVPQITGQQPLSMDQGGSLTVSLTDLTVTDPDNNYPADFTLKLSGGKNYTFNGTTVTPSPNFSGQLTVSVTVNDGQADSKKFDLVIDVVKKQNVAPQITGQQPLSVAQGGSITIDFSNLIVTDPDNPYPTGFTMKVYPGNSYSFSTTTITPTANFTGQLTVPVTVNDGQNESNRFDLKIDVIGKQNVAPQITGQQPLSIAQGGSIIVDLNNLVVTDPDNPYPTGFSLKIFAGANFTFNGTTVTPSPDFAGQLTVPVTVNDGQNESNRFDLKIDVVGKQNVAPQITGQQPLSVAQGGSLTVALNNLTVTDPDNTYPAGFTLTVLPGTDYTSTGTIVTPAPAFTGTLTVSVMVNDGQNVSNVFPLKIAVIQPQNVIPQITGQDPLTVNEDEAINLSLPNLKVTDPDNTYPQGFTLKVGNGANYTVAGLVITPTKDFSGDLTIPVTVNDGANDSAPFTLKITVLPVNDAPVITGQSPKSGSKNTLITIALSDLTVTDVDNTYPTDFTLTIISGDNYSFAGDIVTPALGFAGILTVVVTVSDGKTTSAPFNMKVEVTSPVVNAPPTIIGQRPVKTSPGKAVTLQFSHLLVADPDNEYPRGFTLKVSPGDGYTVTGTTVTPSPTTTGTFTVSVQVNDGKDDSQPFPLSIEIVAPTATPRIIAQKELRMAEDSTLLIQLTDLVVTDADNPNYPAGFVLIVSSSHEGMYSRSGNQITPALNYNGFLEVGVKVSDGTNVSEEFNVAILVTPVNDPPEFVHADTTALAYVPGHDPLGIFETIDIRDVDDDHLVMAEVGFEGSNFSSFNDRCVVSNEHSSVRTVYDSAGRLYLIGYAPLQEYLDAIRSIEYNYMLTKDDNGHTQDVLPGPRTVYLTVSDGHLASATVRRKISMDLQVSLEIPSAFTPNGDRQNDTWHIDLLNADKIDQAHVRVFDKRGALMYESVGFDADWDGFFDGKKLPVDTYYYTIDLNLSYTQKTYKGTVVVLY
jgi:gliding motility-associated-like protein